ncbi:hypothetical protein LTR37_010707 [Vermiconidia calcicola]|uniref:Uncharacterized protein n=1 Tax=Vermiconidia calcicola TaxID=1690605 RepID=A0ACC3N449_9PEZI|nr:hypothetical protein LTR37_010707 [Vermiconidia calcicola]
MAYSYCALAVALLHVLTAACQTPAFNVTAISAKDNASRLQCWQLDAKPELSRAAVNFDLGEFDKSFVGIIPPQTTGGTLSNAQAVQYSLVMAGQVHVTTPYSGLPDELNEVWVEGGRYGFLIAADTVDVASHGHITEFPSHERTVIAQFPVKGNKAPEHSVLHEGPCVMADFEGW